MSQVLIYLALGAGLFVIAYATDGDVRAKVIQDTKAHGPRLPLALVIMWPVLGFFLVKWWLQAAKRWWKAWRVLRKDERLVAQIEASNRAKEEGR